MLCGIALHHDMPCGPQCIWFVQLLLPTVNNTFLVHAGVNPTVLYGRRTVRSTVCEQLASSVSSWYQQAALLAADGIKATTMTYYRYLLVPRALLGDTGMASAWRTGL
jgi:hypothetical protein